MTSNIKVYHINLLKKVWGDIGQRFIKTFKPDVISGVVVNFFSNERGVHHPSLNTMPNKGLMLMGSKGIGKTINFLIYQRIQARYGELGMRIVSAKQIETNVKIRGEQYIQDLIDCKELMIDDIGTESQTFKDFGTDRNLIHDILMQRYISFQRGETITHATTNLNVDLLKKFYDARLIDRMKEMFILKIVTGESKR